jgi:hypothetical protein
MDTKLSDRLQEKKLSRYASEVNTGGEVIDDWGMLTRRFPSTFEDAPRSHIDGIASGILCR